MLAVVRGESAPTTADLAWSLLGGLAGGIGITTLYQALAVSRMGIVAPVTGVIAALIPVTAGIVLEGIPAPLVLVGIGLAVAAVILVSRVRDDRVAPSGLALALVAGVSLGTFGVIIAQLSEGHAFGPLAIIRATGSVFIGVVIVISRSAWRPERRLVPAISVVGVLDMAGLGAYILAVQSGALAVAAVLSSLYPVTTVILAAIVLRERVTRTHALGIGLAVGAIFCIAAGST